MSEVQEQEFGGLETMFENRPSVAEEPVKEEEKETPVAEEVKAEETKNPAAKEEQTEKEPKAEAEEGTKEDNEPNEDGVTVVDWGEAQEEKKPTEDIEAYKTRLADLEEQIAKLKETPKLDPRIEKLNQIIQNGGDINQTVWEMQSKDYDKINLQDTKDGFGIVSDKLKFIDGDDNDMVSIYLDDKYPTLRGKKTEDDFDSDEDFAAQKKREEVLLRKEAKTNISDLKEFQEKMRLPEAPNHQVQKQQEEAYKRYQAESTTKLNEIQHFDVELDAETKLRFPFAGEGREFAKSIVTNPENQAKFFVSRYQKEDGTADYNSFAEDMWFLSNRAKVFNSLYAQGKSAGKKEVLSELQSENSTLKTNQKPPKQKLNENAKGIAQMKF